MMKRIIVATVASVVAVLPISAGAASAAPTSKPKPVVVKVIDWE
ncbi:MAG: hypothetical protein PGN07_05160 [Aeromicrobium erythreum]